MGEWRQSETVRPGLIPHRWTRIDDPDAIAVVAAHETVIAGGGPAGLTAAYELSKHGKRASSSKPTRGWSAESAGPTSTRAIASTSAATDSFPRATRSIGSGARSSATS